MKNLALKVVVFLILIAQLFIVNSCQDNEILLPEADMTQLKSATFTSDYITDVISEIESMMSEGIINQGLGNALILKLERALDLYETGKIEIAENILKAFTNQVDDLIATEVITSEEGKLLIDILEDGNNEGNFIDERDGHEYKWIKIGEQIWMAENLAYLPSVSPPSGESYTEPYYYVYGYSGSGVNEAKATDNYKTYGVLYNWPAAKSACPSGWHLPTDAEWTQLNDYLSANGYSGIEGTALKATSGWYADGNGNDDYGFSALPGGFRNYDGSFFHIGGRGYWWSASESSTSKAWSRYLGFSYTFVSRNFLSKENGFSIRCVRD
jgi:uncharacterized protein (TIGR02145 family)